MGLRERLGTYAVGGAHVLTVEVPGSWGARVAVERAAAARGWHDALSPADADVLVVCGEPGAALAAATDRVWDQMPGPRARVAVLDDDAVERALDEAAGVLLDDAAQRADARDRAQHPSPAGGMDHGGMDHGGMDHGGMDHGGMDHGGMDHGGMDHGGMDMAPGGIALAAAGPDRDGLEMDVLHVPLGPVLAHWPAGLVLRCALQGDVVVEAAVEVLTGSGAPPGAAQSGAVRAARHCDSAARALALAGWEGAAVLGRRARDGALVGDVEGAGRLLGRLQVKVARSSWLRWQLRGLGVVDMNALGSRDLPANALGDVFDRIVAMLGDASTLLVTSPGTPNDGPDDAPGDAARQQSVLDALPALVAGLDLAAVRLVVASLDPDTAPRRAQVTRD